MALWLWVREALGHDPFGNDLHSPLSADRLKDSGVDGSGLVLFWKRLEHGAFRWPPVNDGAMRQHGAATRRRF